MFYTPFLWAILKMFSIFLLIWHKLSFLNMMKLNICNELSKIFNLKNKNYKSGKITGASSYLKEKSNLKIQISYYCMGGNRCFIIIFPSKFMTSCIHGRTVKKGLAFCSVVGLKLFHFSRMSLQVANRRKLDSDWRVNYRWYLLRHQKSQ